MSLFNVSIILLCVLGISTGQILFKLASPYFPTVLSGSSIIGFVFNNDLCGALLTETVRLNADYI
jgi:hypothetical protein